MTEQVPTATQPARPPDARASFTARHGNTAQIVSALVSILGFAVVAMQVNLIRTNAREAAARQVYMSYSESALRYPNFVEPDVDRLHAGNPEEWIRYKSFVAHMLFAYDEIFVVYDDPEWHRSFEGDVRYHRRYICKWLPESSDESYFKRMRGMLKAERAKCTEADKS